MACLIYLLILICLLGDINNLNVKEILKIYSIEIKYIQITKMSDMSITVLYPAMSLTVRMLNVLVKLNLLSVYSLWPMWSTHCIPTIL